MAKAAFRNPNKAFCKTNRTVLTLIDFKTENICKCTQTPDQPQENAQSAIESIGTVV